MVKTVFGAVIVRNLCTYFERAKPPSEDTIDMWFAKCANIPDEPLEWIVDRIKDNLEAFPRNLPNTVWEYYRDWLSTYPEKSAHKMIVDCKKCNSTGYIFTIKTNRESKMNYEYAFRCNACKQANDNGLPLWANQLVDQGYYPIPERESSGDIKSVKQLIKKITTEDEIPF